MFWALIGRIRGIFIRAWYCVIEFLVGVLRIPKSIFFTLCEDVFFYSSLMKGTASNPMSNLVLTSLSWPSS